MSILELAHFTGCGAHQKGHFLLSSGLHSGDYLQCALYLADTARARDAGQRLARATGDGGVAPELVVSPALGGLIIGHETAEGLGVPFLFTERDQGVMKLRRGFAVAPGQPVLVVEDVVTTGKSTREVIAALEEGGAVVIGVASLVNRSGIANPFAPRPFQTLLELDFPVWRADECPLCRQKIPIAAPGSRPIR
jgi:orotate phosphoribosyltransferase